jgi:hypothetical protein
MILKACISLVPFFLESMGDEVNHIMTFISLNPRLFQSGNLIMTTVDVSTLPKFISVFNLLHHFFFCIIVVVQQTMNARKWQIIILYPAKLVS